MVVSNVNIVSRELGCPGGAAVGTAQPAENPCYDAVKGETMASKSNGISSSTLLSLSVGLFLVLSGILNIIDANSFMGKLGGMFASDMSKTVGIVSAILKIVSGAVLVIGPFGLLN